MTLSEQIAPILKLAIMKRQVVVPEWLQPEAKSDSWWDTRLYPKSNERSTHVPIHPTAAALIVTGALAKWLASFGLAVVWRQQDLRYYMVSVLGSCELLPPVPDFLSALLAATNARLDELPDKEKV